ncbi:putative alpha-1,3-glucanase [Penicillium oxalicum 114-2]|uniref:Putative alpha-1,3-glucanase n=1 Tax=Penicillium oxalicum (strain 114-2 / CGMCC 5302) TaxID=933388 RepID=S8A1L5_PENO1|nr:putative alpha-1,3-glucanase [Penicillium oxalicum 114-2]
MGLYLLCSLAFIFCQVQARAVFAHFMVSNTEGYTVADWEAEMTLAFEAHIDAFALNIAANQPVNDHSLGNAFLAAENVGFYLFFSFDYAGNGPWAKADVIELIQFYKSPNVYYHYNSQPFVSTFEGPANAVDWVEVKKETGCFFAPDWSSLGAMEAMKQADGVADALFSWAAWPNGPVNMDTYTDASYINYLEGKPYMMPVSPWFFTNMPGYDKNWLWRGDDIWFDRWNQALFLAPEFVEIISWNDFGESHYIGPIRAADDPLADQTYTAFDTGRSPYNYALDMPHDGWRIFLPYVIDTYKNNISTITQEGVTGWYRLNKAGACSSDGGTTGNTYSQLQVEYWPYEIVQDKIFYSALLGSGADVLVSVGGADLGASWTSTPSGGIGIYHGSVSFTGYSGSVVISINRGGASIATIKGQSISTGCAAASGVENWNAWVGSAISSTTINVAPTSSLGEQTCVEGWGVDNFLGLCERSCSWGYCPITACVCSELGPPPTVPKDTGVQGYPIAGEDASYSGLCSFDCNHGYCPTTACGTAEVPLTIPTVSDFAPPACTAGEGSWDLANLCVFACAHGYCPIHACTCTATGTLDLFTVVNASATAHLISGEDDYGLCDFACQRGNCFEECGEGAGASDFEVCDYSKTFSSLDDLATAASGLRTDCIAVYSLQVLIDMLDTAYENYTNVNSGYDALFGYYVTYIENLVPVVLLGDFMFNMSTTGPFANIPNTGYGMDYFQCTLGDGNVIPCSDLNQTTFVNERTLPYDTTAFKLTDAQGYDAGLAKAGLLQNWVDRGDYTMVYTFEAPRVGSLKRDYKFSGFPIKNESMVVPNPKHIVTNALPNIPALRDEMQATLMDIMLGQWLNGSSSDAADAYSTLVFMFIQGIEGMAEAKKLGQQEKKTEQEEEKRKKDFIVMIVSVVLLFVPVVGEEVAAAAGLVTLARSVAIAGELANGALAIYDTVQNPSSAVVNILGMLFGVGSITKVSRDGQGLASVAKLRREMKPEEIASLGGIFKSNDDKLRSIMKVCNWKK